MDKYYFAVKKNNVTVQLVNPFTDQSLRPFRPPIAHKMEIQVEWCWENITPFAPLIAPQDFFLVGLSWKLNRAALGFGANFWLFSDFTETLDQKIAPETIGPLVAPLFFGADFRGHGFTKRNDRQPWRPFIVINNALKGEVVQRASPVPFSNRLAVAVCVFSFAYGIGCLCGRGGFALVFSWSIASYSDHFLKYLCLKGVGGLKRRGFH